jgi:hypothetical protein
MAKPVKVAIVIGVDGDLSLTVVKQMAEKFRGLVYSTSIEIFLKLRIINVELSSDPFQNPIPSSSRFTRLKPRFHQDHGIECE